MRLRAFLVIALLPLTGWAEVKVSPEGFLVRHEMTIAAPPARVYDALVREVGSWWNPSHTFTGDARNLSIDARGGLSWRLRSEGTGTKLELSYTVGGFMPDGFEQIAPAVERVLGEQAQRPKLFVETGKPTA